MSAVSNDPELAHLVQEPGINLWYVFRGLEQSPDTDGISRIGPHRHAVAYAMRGESLLNLVLECPESKDPSKWDKSTYVKDIQALFQGWDPKYCSVVFYYDKFSH